VPQRRPAIVKTPDREIVLRDVPVGDSPYNLLQQVNAAGPPKLIAPNFINNPATDRSSFQIMLAP
jgi:hypothetical protein